MTSMELDPTICYQAVLSRDPRFDGRFFGGVVTTGVYCRPICRVRPPKPENIRWFACAAAAEAAGFRPCRRCRPEAAPGTSAWLGSSAVVSRALRLISEGVMDESGLEELSARLGVGSRHLRRLFAEHLGVSPLAIARARRVHFAARLIQETELPITEIAFAAGFGSVRQFNHAVLSAFGQSPTQIRNRRGLKTELKQMKDARNGGGLALRLPYRPPLDWAAMNGFFKQRATPGVEAVDGDCYRRTIQLNSVAGVIELRRVANGAYLLMHVWLPSYECVMQVAERARRIFDLGADPLQIAEHLRRCPALADALTAAPGLRVPGAWDGFELAVRAVLGQQVSVTLASTLAGRLAKAFGAPLPGYENLALTHLFPQSETLAEADLRVIGITEARANTIRALASSVARGELELDASQGQDEAISRLRAIPGIDDWTANYIAMRALGETDAFPTDDLGLRRALSIGKGEKSRVSVRELTKIADEWRPWRAYAAMHLWAGLAGAVVGNEGGRIYATNHTATKSRGFSSAACG
jgi:AraC family transcriptional regulator, regulatory protein of adaptative response / DNA-3-methyladenine glycosylase II